MRISQHRHFLAIPSLRICSGPLCRHPQLAGTFEVRLRISRAVIVGTSNDRCYSKHVAPLCDTTASHRLLRQASRRALDSARRRLRARSPNCSGVKSTEEGDPHKPAGRKRTADHAGRQHQHVTVDMIATSSRRRVPASVPPPPHATWQQQSAAPPTPPSRRALALREPVPGGRSGRADRCAGEQCARMDRAAAHRRRLGGRVA
jgi:hypothetical protein